MLKIIVCMKLVLDPEAPVSSFKVDPEARRVIPPKGTPPVLNPFDENALEAALKIKESQESKITIISMGRNLAKPVLRKSLAVCADELILLEDNAFEDLDSYSAAYILASAIRKMGECDLVICGRQAADTDAGQVGSGIAEILGIPSITVACKIEVIDRKARVERVTSDGYEVIEAPMPVLITASNEIGELRSPSMKEIIAAQKKNVSVWNANDLGVDPARLKRTKLYQLFQPFRESNCEIVGGGSPEEAAVNLVLKLKETKIL